MMSARIGRESAIGGVLSLTVLLLGMASCLQSQPAHTRLIYSHSLLNTTPTAGETIVNGGGTFIASRGWQSQAESSQLTITLAAPLPFEGTAIINVTNFDPVSQNTYEYKQHIFNLYSRVYPNNKDVFYTDAAWCNIRTGSAYSTGPGVAGFKFLAAARGLGTRDEERCVESNTWNLNRTYEFKIIWTRTYTWCYLDGVLMSRLPFSGQVEPFKYILIGRDNLIWGYSAQPGVIFANLRIYGRENPLIHLSGKAHLQGPYQTTTHTMRTPGAAGYALPLQSPYAQAPYTATSIPATIVDWVLLSLRPSATASPLIWKSFWLRQDGRLIDPQSGSTTCTWPIDSGRFFVALHHRNHLSALTADTLLFDGINASSWDFSTALDQYYNSRGAAEVEPGIWALQSGDLNADGLVNNGDYSLWLSASRNGAYGYADGDFNLDGVSTTRDYVIWYNNAFLAARSGMP